MENLVRKNILSVNHYVPGKPIEEVRRELGLDDVIKLASNENCFGPSPRALAAVRKSLESINRYPDASCFYLKKKMSRSLGVGEDQLIFGNGSDEIIGLAVRTFIDDGDEVVIARPTFLIYEIASQIHNAAVKQVALTKDFKYDLKAMKKAVTGRTKMVFIANPDNPTGAYVTKAELDGFLKGLPPKVIVYLDEAYFEFANYSFRDYPNGLDYINPLRRTASGRELRPSGRTGSTNPAVIVSRSFSKAYGLAGLRIGYGISNPELIGYMERVRDPFNVNLLAQAGALAALDDKQFLKKTLSHVAKEKEKLYSAFRDMGLEYVRSATNFIIVNVKRDCKEVFNRLLKKGVIVRDMKAWGLDTYIRVTIGTSSENKRFVATLKKSLSA